MESQKFVMLLAAVLSLLVTGCAFIGSGGSGKRARFFHHQRTGWRK